MSNFLISFNAVLPTFIIMAVGYIAKRAKVLKGSDYSKMNAVAFKVFMPCITFYNIYNTDLSQATNPKLFAYIVIAAVLSFFMSVFYVQRTEKDLSRRSVMIQGIFRNNYIIMGMPIAEAIVGAENLGLISVLVAIVIPTYNMLATVTLEVFGEKKTGFKKTLIGILKNPLIVAAFIAIFVKLIHFTLPDILVKVIKNMGGVASPFMLFLLGSFFHFEGIVKYRRELFVATVGKLVVIPGIFMSIGALLGFRGIEFVALIPTFASPTGVNSFVMAEQMGGDAELAGNIVIVTSALCSFTIFLWIYLFKSLGMF